MNKDLFPTIPVTCGIAYPVFLSPIVGSGERICIAAVSSVSGSEFEVSRAFDTGDCMLPEKLCLLIDTTIKAITRYVLSGNDIVALPELLRGLYLGEAIEGAFQDCAMASRTVFRNHSMLYRGK